MDFSELDAALAKLEEAEEALVQADDRADLDILSAAIEAAQEQVVAANAKLVSQPEPMIEPPVIEPPVIEPPGLVRSGRR